MSVLDKTVQVIDVLGRASGPMRLGAVAEHVAMPKSSAHRLLAELAQLGLVRRAGEGEYALGYRLVQWGHLADRSVGLRSLAEPVMTELRDDVRESVHLYVRQDNHRVCVLSVEGPHTLRPVAVLGSPMPLGYGAAGKLLLAHADERVQLAVERELPEHRGRTLPTREELAAIRDRGVSVSIGEMEDGLTAVATPVRAPGGGVFAALAVASVTTRMPVERHSEIVTRLADAAGRISVAIGG
ncbi:IclR family transcriptional regulator [Nocardioides sp. W7]|uniref:IclR family transcriptional regulator n=1 Tax=Nocardioides sp. W7 TaxID=2931390 RepID=UPI001FD1A464|nr:IclR family transcriptional regulator [Nocardioides sp. W7]